MLVGEALARIGFGGGGSSWRHRQASCRARRDGVLLALRKLTGTTEEAYGRRQWPWGLHGLREVLRPARERAAMPTCARYARGERARRA